MPLSCMARSIPRAGVVVAWWYLLTCTVQQYLDGCTQASWHVRQGRRGGGAEAQEGEGVALAPCNPAMARTARAPYPTHGREPCSACPRRPPGPKPPRAPVARPQGLQGLAPQGVGAAGPTAQVRLAVLKTLTEGEKSKDGWGWGGKLPQWGGQKTNVCVCLCLYVCLRQTYRHRHTQTFFF